MKNSASPLMIALTFLLLTACTEPGQSPNKKNTTPGFKTQLEQTGTGDGGGGNALNYKMLESHLIDPNELEVVKTRLSPVLEKLFPASEGQSRGDIFAIKNWYLAPIKLKTIPKDVLGIDFTSDRIQQVAIQTEKAVWIDSDYFEKMNRDEQARLIMHEILMSVYLMRFEDMSSLCDMSKRSGFQGCSDLSSEDFARLGEQFKPEPKRRLIDADYEAIRAATAWVFAHESELSKDSFDAYTDRIGFSDKRFRTSTEDKNSEPSTTQKTIDQINLVLKKAKLSGKLKSTCLALHSKITFNCDFNWSLSEKPHPEAPQVTINTLTLTITDSNTGKVIQQTAAGYSPLAPLTLTQYQGVDHLFFYPSDLWTNNESGKRFSATSLSFKKDEQGNLTLTGVLMLPLVYIDSEKYEETRTDNGEERKYTCEKHIFSRPHPMDPTTDTIVLMTHDGDFEKVSFMDLLRFNDFTNCQGPSL